MKKLLLISISIVLILNANAQPWAANLPNDKLENGQLSFYDLQQAFNQYNIDQSIIKGNKIVDGKKIKVPGWKQYKRWEWFWETRVDIQTGAFPKQLALDKLKSFNSQKRGQVADTGNWQPMGPNSSYGGYAGVGRINCIAFHPTDNNTFWVGAASGGIWVTYNGGQTWQILNNQTEVLGVSDIAIPTDYQTSNTIYIATGDKNGGSSWSLGGQNYCDNNSIGVLKSTDSGQTWQTTGLTYTVSQNKQIGRLLIHPKNNNIILAGTSDGIYKTENGGQTWALTYSGEYVIDIEYKPTDSVTIYASTKKSGASKILKSTDAGNSFTTIKIFSTNSARAEIAVTPANPDYLYTIVANRDGGLETISMSTDSGDTFTQMVNGNNDYSSYLYYYSDGSGDNNGQGTYDLCIAASPLNKDIVLIGGVNTWKSSNAAQNWTICNMWTSYDGYNFSSAPEVHADKHSLTYRPDGTLFETNDGGVYKSTNNGLSWTDITNGMAISQLYRLGVSQTNKNLVITGLQDNGTKLHDNGEWHDVKGGDGMECIIDYTNSNYQYGTYVNGEIERTTDGWSSYNTKIISKNIPDEEGGHWVTPYVMNPKNPSVLYVGYADVWRTNNRGNSFTKIGALNSSAKLRSLAVSPADTATIIAADLRNIWITTNSGSTWTKINSNLPLSTNQITYVTAGYLNKNDIWVTMGGYNSNRVFYSNNAGENWTDISDGLPPLPTMCIVQNKQITNFNQLYVGTDAGVYVKNGTNPWQRFSKGLPNVYVSELDIYYDETNPGNSMLRAATFGRGLWESNLIIPILESPIAGFEADLTTIKIGEAVTFTDKSTNTPTKWEWFFDGGSPETSQQQNPQITYNAPGTYSIKLIASNPLGSDTIIKQDYITVTDYISASFSASPLQGIYPLTVSFTNNSVNATTYHWTFGNGQTSDDKNPQVTYTKPGSYKVSLYVSNANLNDSLVRDNLIIVDWPTPVTQFEATPVTGVEPLTVKFNNLSEHGVNYIWDFGDNATSNEQHPEHVYNTGTYTVKLEVSNPNATKVITKNNFIVVKNADAINATQKHGIKVYPNPAYDIITISSNNTNNSECSIEIYNIIGKLTEKRILTNARFINETINVKQWPKGQYFIKVVVDNKVVMDKIMVE